LINESPSICFLVVSNVKTKHRDKFVSLTAVVDDKWLSLGLCNVFNKKRVYSTLHLDFAKVALGFSAWNVRDKTEE
jgi:hypothetical protein